MFVIGSQQYSSMICIKSYRISELEHFVHNLNQVITKSVCVSGNNVNTVKYTSLGIVAEESNATTRSITGVVLEQPGYTGNGFVVVDGGIDLVGKVPVA